MYAKKRIVTISLALVMLLGAASTALAYTSFVNIPFLNYFVMHALKKGDSVIFSYTNNSATTGTVVARITDPNGSSSGVAGKLQGTYSVVYPNGSSMQLGTISGTKLAGGCNFLAPGASFRVTLTAPNEAVGLKIKFDAQ